MDDNIVASLRYSAEWIKEMEHESWLGTAELQIEAADAIQQRDAEIERLRTEALALTQDLFFLNAEVNKFAGENYEQYCEIQRLRGEVERLRAERDVSRLIISDGAWFVHGTDYDDYPLALFGDELSARRWADEQGNGYVVFWPFGKTWSEMQKRG